MLKKLLCVAIALVAMLSARAQDPMSQPLPLKQEVKSGVLPNGLHYYILHNELPKGRANFYIAQKVGSTLEEPNQLGLAHFLEHMAFNGTTHYPGKNLLNYLQGKGIRFGQDINAYTGFDETVYNIDNVPTSDKALMDSVLLALRDWSCDIALETNEIEEERGVINEEWRQRNDVDFRQLAKILPQIYKEYQYHQTPIGSMDVVMNFKPEALRAYYEKWYRPDQQGIVIVGDFDAAEMEKKVVAMFSDIVMPENAAPRLYAAVSDNEAPIYATFQDAEQQVPVIRICFKSDELPFEQRNTIGALIDDSFVKPLIASMINYRLQEASQKPGSAFTSAGVIFTQFYISATKDAFMVSLVPQDDINAAIQQVMEIVARACKTGFTESELARVRDTMMTGYEQQYNERDKVYNTPYGKEIIRHFIDNIPMPGIETEYQLAQMILPQLPVAALNQAAAQILTPTNQVITISAPATSTLPTEAEAVADVNNAINKEYEAYVDEVITEPLIKKFRKAGKIKSKKQNAALGVTEYVLSNGAKVVVKSTDFASDQILMQAFAEGGKRSYQNKDYANVLMLEDAYSCTKLGSFDRTQLQKYLAGKHAGVGFTLGRATNSLQGMSSVKDFPTLMELIYANFTSINPDPEKYEVMKTQGISQLKNQEKDPSFVLGERISTARYGNNPMMKELTVPILEAANYNECVKMLQKDFSNAADFTFIFVGNVDEATLEPLMEKYIASLPSKGKPSKVKTYNDMAVQAGQIEDNFTLAMTSPVTTVFDEYTNTGLEFNVENVTKLDLTSEVLQLVYTATLREEEGGTYGAGTAGSIAPLSKQWYIVYQFQTAADKKDRMVKRAHDELVKLLSNGTDEVSFNKVKEAALAQLTINERTNKYWFDNLLSYYRGYDMVTGQRAVLENMTLADLNAFMKSLNISQNRIQVVCVGEEAK